MNEIKTLNGYPLADETARTAAEANAEAIGQLTEEIDNIKENGGGGTLNPYHNVEEVLFEKQYPDMIVPLTNRQGLYAHIFSIEVLNTLKTDSLSENITFDGDTETVEGMYIVLNSTVYPVEWTGVGSGSSFHLICGDPSMNGNSEHKDYPFCIPHGFGQFIVVNSEPALQEALSDIDGEVTIVLSPNPNEISIEVVNGESGNYIAAELISPEIARKQDIPMVSSSGGGDIFVVHYNFDDGSVDATSVEIKAAYESGKAVFLHGYYNPYQPVLLMPLTRWTDDDPERAAFTGVYYVRDSEPVVYEVHVDEGGGASLEN